MLLTEDTDIIETHTEAGWHRHAHTHGQSTDSPVTQTSNTHWTPPPTLLPLPLSAASINQQKSSPSADVILIDGTWSISFLFLPPLLHYLLCRSVPSVSRIGKAANKQPALTPQQINCLQQSWSQCSDYSYAGIIGRDCSGAARPLEGAGCTEENGMPEWVQMGQRGISTEQDWLYLLMCFRWMTVNVWAL